MEKLIYEREACRVSGNLIIEQYKEQLELLMQTKTLH